MSDYRETLREILCETFLCVCVCTGTQEGEVCVYVCVWKEEKRSGCVLCLGQGCRGGRVRFDAMGDKTNVVQRKRVGVKEVGLSLNDQERTTVLYGMRVCVSV